MGTVLGVVELLGSPPKGVVRVLLRAPALSRLIPVQRGDGTLPLILAPCALCSLTGRAPASALVRRRCLIWRLQRS
jgi:hypothetical protein